MTNAAGRVRLAFGRTLATLAMSHMTMQHSMIVVVLICIKQAAWLTCGDSNFVGLCVVTTKTALLIFCLCLSSCANNSLKIHLPAEAENSKRTEVVVVGTIHKAHLMTSEYQLAKLGSLLDSYKPDLVLLEIRPKAFEENRWEDGPFEMTYLAWLAREAKIAVEPIDWFDDDDVGYESAPSPEDQAAYEREVAALSKDISGPPSFLDMHSEKMDAVNTRILNIEARYSGGNAKWNQRQAWLNHLALMAISKHKGRRVMVFVGGNHRPELQQFLATQGATLVNPKSLMIRELKPTPAEVVQLWREGIVRMKEEAAHAPKARAQALQSKIQYFTLAVEREGTCCFVPPAE